MAKIGMDYGHGGSDPGAVYSGRRESADVLRLGLAITDKLRAAGLTVGESRNGDTAVSLMQRSRLSNERADEYFLSIHRNAFRPETAKGAEVFVHPTASDDAVNLARSIQSALTAVGFVDRGVKRANFYVLRETRAPAVLLEVGFVDNSEDNDLFDREFDNIVSGVSQAVLTHIGQSGLHVNKPSLQADLEVLCQHGILQSPAYWEQNATTGQTVRGDYVAVLIQRIAAYLRNLEN